MIEPRIYRAVFLPAVLVVLLVMFSLESPPPALPQGLAADVLFEGDVAASEMRNIVRRHPDRRPGTSGDQATAELVAERLRRRGFETASDSFSADGRDLTNVIGRRVGASRRVIVVMAARDAGSVPDAPGSAADTAALLQFATVFQGRAARRTLVLASVGGPTVGDAGARRFADTFPDRDQIDAVLVLSNLGARGSPGSPLIAWSNDASRGGIGLMRTATASLRQEVERPVEEEGPLGQLARLAFPLGVGAQGPLLERELEAIRFSGSGELPSAGDGALGEVDADGLGALGRAALRTFSAIDGGPPLEHGPASYVTVARQVLPSWAVSLLALALLLPAVVASVDGFARARRRRQRVGRWAVWVLLAALPFAAALLAAELLQVVGLLPDAPSAPFPPPLEPLDLAGAAALALIALAAALVWRLTYGRRPAAAPAPGGNGARSQGAPVGESELVGPGPASALGLLLSAAALVAWLTNPFLALLLVPAAHLWLLAVLGEFPARARVRALLVALGLVPFLAVAIFYLVRLSIDPLEGLWYGLLLVTGHHVGLLTAAGGCVMLGILAATIAIVVARARQPQPEAPDRPAVRGPGGHAGPGALGGTPSALRR